jgi:serine phosphatase RsbU (regulator of sigma subunit)
MKMSFKITLMIVLMVALCSGFIGVFVFRHFAEELYMLKGMTAQTAADTLVAALDPEAIRLLDATEVQDEYYRYLENVLADVYARTIFEYVYILTLTDNNTHYKVIYGTGAFSQSLGSKDPIEIWNEAALRCFETGEHTSSQPYYVEDLGEIGDLMSGYAPLLDTDGNVTAIVGLDIPLDDIRSQLDAMKTAITITILTFVVLFSVISVLFVKVRIGNPVTKLSELSKHIAAGHLDYAVNIRSKDEIGILADNLLQVKTVLNNVNEEIRSLAKNAAAGEMQTRASASKYTGDWGVLLTELNHLLDTLNVPIDYAAGIQKSLLPKDADFNQVFADHSILWSPRDIVGGDIYWLKHFSEGTVLCVCDCTGHGTPGALLTMLVVSAFDNMIDETNYTDSAQILWNLEQRLVSIFRSLESIQEGCDLAVLYIAKDGSVCISAGNTPVFVCDGTEVRHIKGQRIHVGEGKIKGKEDIAVVHIPAKPGSKFYIASDGLFDQIGQTTKLPLGYKTIMQIILEKHNESQAVISNEIWAAFEKHQGNEARRDDVELISFKI